MPRSPHLPRFPASANHRLVGTLYLAFAIMAGCAGGAFSLVMRAQLLDPSAGLMNGLAHLMGQNGDGSALYRAIVAAHGTIMVFFTVVPATLGGFGNWLLPTLLGAPALALPKLDRAALLLLPIGLCLLLAGLWHEATIPSQASWLSLAGLGLAGLSALLGAINIATSVINMRSPRLALLDVPLFAWSLLLASLLLIMAVPVLFGALTLVVWGHGLTDPALIRQTVQSFSEPELQITLLPALGLVSHVVATCSGRALVGRLSLGVTLAVVMLMAFLLWADRLYGSGLIGPDARWTGMLLAVPAGAALCAWATTLRARSGRWTAPLLWAAGFPVLIAIGGVSGIAAAFADLPQRSTDGAAAVAQLHYALSLGTVFALFAGFYAGLPRVTGLAYDDRLAKLQFWLMLIGVNLTFGPQRLLGLMGMPAHAMDYPERFAFLNQLSSVGSFLSGLGLLVFVGVLADMMLRPRPARPDMLADEVGPVEAAPVWSAQPAAR